MAAERSFWVPGFRRAEEAGEGGPRIRADAVAGKQHVSQLHLGLGDTTARRGLDPLRGIAVFQGGR